MGTIQRTITVAGRPIPLSVYLTGIRLAIANPDTLFRDGLRRWGPEKGRDIRRDFLRGVHDRINQRVRYVDRGRMTTDSTVLVLSTPVRFYPSRAHACSGTLPGEGCYGDRQSRAYCDLKPGELVVKVGRRGRRVGGYGVYEARPFGLHGSRWYAVLRDDQIEVETGKEQP